MRQYRKYTYDFNNEDFNRIKEKNIKVLMFFFKNNSYLLKKNNLIFFRQIKELKAKGLTVDYGNISKLRDGKRFSSSLTYLNFFCDYWGLELKDMISIDLEEYDKRLENGKEI